MDLSHFGDLLAPTLGLFSGVHSASSLVFWEMFGINQRVNRLRMNAPRGLGPRLVYQFKRFLGFLSAMGHPVGKVANGGQGKFSAGF